MDDLTRIFGKSKKKLNFRIPELIYETLRKDAENQGITIADLLRDLVWDKYQKVLINDAIVLLKHHKRGPGGEKHEKTGNKAGSPSAKVDRSNA